MGKLPNCDELKTSIIILISSEQYCAFEVIFNGVEIESGELTFSSVPMIFLVRWKDYNLLISLYIVKFWLHIYRHTIVKGPCNSLFPDNHGY